MANFKHSAITTQELALSGSGYTALVSPANAVGMRAIMVPFSVGDYADADTSELIRLASSARIVDFYILNPANTGATAVTIGIGRPVVGGAPTVLSATIISDTLNMTTVRTTWTRVFGNGTLAVRPVADPNVTAGVGSPLWLLAGLTADPGGQLSIVFSWATATTAAGPFINAALIVLTGEN